MKKHELITLLEQIPDNMEICIFDHRKNFDSCDGGTGEASGGIYDKFEVSPILEDGISEGYKPFVTLSFDNPDYED